MLKAGLALAVLAVFLAFGLFTTSVAIKTGTIAGGSSGMVGCYTSGTSGDLVTDLVSGVAIIERTGRRIAVTWPPGWTGRRSGTEVEIVDSHGDVHMRTGTHVYLMGGYWYVDGSFLTCGGRTGF
jgi:hypothetical protein